MSLTLPVFKSWVPVWLIRAAIFLVIFPGLLLFGLSTASGAGAAGYYGIEPADVQYSMVIFYAAVAGFFALERRFFIFIATREYFILSILIQMGTAYVCFHTQNLYILLFFRFLQGMSNCMSTSICITLIFGSLHNERAREIGYSIFYGMLLCITPISTIITAPILDAFDYNVLYKFIIFAYIPGGILLLVIMNNIRLNKKMPLYQLDFYSFIIYALVLCLSGYTLVYGQQYYWLHDSRIVWSLSGTLVLITLHVIRQLHLRRPYLNLDVFKHRNFNVGMFMIFILYLVRGALGIIPVYFAVILGMDPIHIGYIMAANIAGILLSVLISSRLIIMKRPIRLVWLYGFILLLIFHVWMWFLFTTQADPSTFVLPLIIQGMGAGMLMTPIIVFAISSVPEHLGSSASATGVFFRFTGFCSSIALINYFQLQQKSNHINRFQEHLSGLNTVVTERLAQYTGALTNKGMAPDQAAKVARGLLNRTVDSQAQLRAMMDYDLLISILLIAVLLVIALFPKLNRTKINLKSNQPAPASY
ncbi:transporter [Pedobacter cryoconitis]|uniref:Transporter n=1 Tax=Pedobacter cryoconitis TaxID=188932 RepID=A0A127V8A5_9SPHI|nr:MFS transporter [Pedobacter cryoconitis]AMP97500.1 transporter [Pedobacter cryoconitis]